MSALLGRRAKKDRQDNGGGKNARRVSDGLEYWVGMREARETPTLVSPASPSPGGLFQAGAVIKGRSASQDKTG
jgi:hypothetical protein